MQPGCYSVEKLVFRQFQPGSPKETGLTLTEDSAVFNQVGLFGVKGRVKGVEVAGVDLILGDADSLAEPLEMDQLPFPQEADGVLDVGVVDQPEDVVVGKPRLLFRRHVFMQVGEGVAGDLERPGGEGDAGRRLGIDPGGVVDKIGGEPGLFDLFLGHATGQLIDQSADHFDMGQLFGADVG